MNMTAMRLEKLRQVDLALVQIFSMSRVRSWRRIDLRSEDRIPDGGRSLVFEAQGPKGELAFMNTT
jgi:hypothetical protein